MHLVSRRDMRDVDNLCRFMVTSADQDILWMGEQGMDGMELERRRFPIGRHVTVEKYDEGEVRGRIASLAAFPTALWEKAATLDEVGLNRRYRPGGWTARQVIHPVSDSHTNAYIRFKWALTGGRHPRALGRIDGLHGRG